MHDCLHTQANLVELLFDEPGSAARSRLLAEVEACARCDAQYRSLAQTLDLCEEASAAAMPRESYWPQYHAALSRRLHAAAGEMQAGEMQTSHARAQRRQSVPFWKRLLTTSIRVPAPVAAAAVLLLVAVSMFALSLAARNAPEAVVLAAPGSSQGEAAPPQIKFIEVPVVQEKIITQTIYVPRRNSRNDGGGGDAASRRAPVRENLAEVGRQNAPGAEATPRANLSGFKPAGEVNLRIIKGSDAREH
jgi:hypothetical protein